MSPPENFLLLLSPLLLHQILIHILPQPFIILWILLKEAGLVILLHLFFLLFADFLLVVVVDQVDRVFVLLEVFQEFGRAHLLVVLHVLVHLVV